MLVIGQVNQFGQFGPQTLNKSCWHPIILEHFVTDTVIINTIIIIIIVIIKILLIILQLRRTHPRAMK